MSGALDRPNHSRRWWLLAGIVALGLVFGAWTIVASVRRVSSDLSNLPRRAVLRGSGQFAVPLGFSPDGALLATRSGGRVTIWDIATLRPRQVFREFIDSPDLFAAFSPDGRLFATSRYVHATLHIIFVFEVETGRVLLRTEAGKATLLNLGFSPDGTAFHLVAWDSASQSTDPWLVRTWDTATWRERERQPIDVPQQRQVIFSPAAKLLAAFDPYAPDITLWDTMTGAKLATLPTPLTPPALGNIACTFSSDGRTLAVVRHNLALLELWDIPTGRVRRTLGAFSSDDRVKWVQFSSGAPPETMAIVVRDWSHTRVPTSAIFRRVSQFIRLRPSVWMAVPSRVIVWDTASGRILGRVNEAGLGIVSPDGAILATTSNGPDVTLWNLPARSSGPTTAPVRAIPRK